MGELHFGNSRIFCLCLGLHFGEGLDFGPVLIEGETRDAVESNDDDALVPDRFPNLHQMGNAIIASMS